MKLRNKILIGNCLIWIIFLFLSIIESKIYLLNGLLTLENFRTNERLSRIQETIKLSNDSLVIITAHLAQHTELKTIIQNENIHQVEKVIKLEILSDKKINFISLLNKDGKILYIHSFTKHSPLIIPELTKYISNQVKFSQLKNSPYNYLLLDDEINTIAVETIHDDANRIIGYIIAGRSLNKEFLNDISQILKTPVVLYSIGQIKADSSLSNLFYQGLANPSNLFIVRVNNQFLYGYEVIKDIDNNPIGMIQMEVERLAYLHGLKTIIYYLLSLCLLAVVFSIFIIWLLNHFIISKLEKLDNELTNINKKHAFNLRVSTVGNDEFTRVSMQINHMLKIIQTSQGELEKRIIQRTQQLQKTHFKLQKEITEKTTIQKELSNHKANIIKMHHYDNLTSLPNRVLFNEILNDTIAESKKSNRIFALILLNIDNFKKINDAFTYATGDHVLKEVSDRLARLLSSKNVIARLGGDEFIILLNDISESRQISAIIEEIMSTLSKVFKQDNNDIFLTVSLGICIYPMHGNSLEELQKNADLALYNAKNSGGNTYRYFTQEMDSEIHQTIKIENALRRAIQNNEFMLVFQPQLNLKDGSVKRIEALIRWANPELGIINPEKFIPLAEKNNLITPIGEWALREACLINKKWQTQGYDPVIISVNISAKQFYQQDIAKLITDILHETELDPKYLEIEITETAIMENLDVAINKLNHICSMGVEIAIDDFGSGYTSISYLKRFPIKTLKIDQSFIKGIPENKNDCAITTSIIGLSHNLGLKVVAEGVETAAQMQFLSTYDCDFIQGYFFSRPLPASKIILQLNRGESDKDFTP